MSREDYVDRATSKLTAAERIEIFAVARSNGYGGGVLDEPLRTKAADMGLVFKSTGRLRMDVYNLFV